MDDRPASIATKLRETPLAAARRSSGRGEVVPLYAVGSPPRRRSQVMALARRLIDECAAQACKDPPILSEDAVRYLCARSWAHEQFAACVRRAVAANTGSLITGADLGEG